MILTEFTPCSSGHIHQIALMAGPDMPEQIISAFERDPGWVRFDNVSGRGSELHVPYSCPSISANRACFSHCLALNALVDYASSMKPPFHLEFIGATDDPPPREGQSLYLSPVEAGFPSPAEDHLDRRLDLHEHLVRNRTSTFFLRAHGDSMTGAGIHDGDLLIVDRAEAAAHNKVVIAALDGELTVKRLLRRNGRVLLAPENPDYAEIDITEHEHIHIWGVVTYAVHKV